jgi:MFS family permease
MRRNTRRRPPPALTWLMALYLTVLLSIFNQMGMKGSKMLVALHAIDLGASPLAIGALVSTYGVFPLLLALYAGKVSDRMGVRRPMMFGSLLIVVGLLLPLARPVLPVMYAAVAMIGVGSLFFQVSSHNLIGAIGGPDARTANFGTFALGASISSFLAPLLVGFIIDHAGHRPAYGALALVVMVPFICLASYAGFIPAHVKGGSKEGAPGGARLLQDPALRRTVLTSALIITGIELFSFYVPIYGRSIGLSASTIGIVIGMQAAAAFAVRLWMPRLASHYGERKVLTASLVIAGVTYFAFPLVEQAVLLGMISFVLGLGLGCGQPLSIVLIYNQSPPGRAGEALGLRLTANKFTQILVPLLFGSLGTAAGVYPVFWCNGLLLLLGSYLTADKTVRPTESAAGRRQQGERD